jgi:hypothetical protein
VTFVHCNFVFEGAAANTLELMRLLHAMGNHELVVQMLESLTKPSPPPGPAGPAN